MRCLVHLSVLLQSVLREKLAQDFVMITQQRGANFSLCTTAAFQVELEDLKHDGVPPASMAQQLPTSKESQYKQTTEAIIISIYR